jgi:hypothetical protein
MLCAERREQAEDTVKERCMRSIGIRGKHEDFNVVCRAIRLGRKHEEINNVCEVSSICAIVLPGLRTSFTRGHVSRSLPEILRRSLPVAKRCPAVPVS